ncbi:sigma-70 family RNA polymerase sigma factor [Luteolibacter flavescens]|uniref:Sigma-70 family RNA polymerase sigma factor n=1 Tax=Luteolibacter flavescens TaxID=1859460 RepID=A0ABT3FJI8_9BACT|nr:sigma-70 family RNA polymerase sigma factor [Luteolibacter flavescens]MCW1883627.1 sigma-70 family RNA polymerase sigma factor [Luteolibacter flavescens]
MSGPLPPSPTPDPPEAGSFESLLVAHQQRIYFFIRSMVFNPEDARDVLQDVNAIILRKKERFTPGTDFKSWSFAIARFECLSYLRRYQGQKAVPSEELLDHLAGAAEARADDLGPWLGALSECRKLLPGESVSLLDLRYHTRMPLDEIAGKWNTTEGALKQKLFRIRNQLKNCILGRLAGRLADD